MKVFLILMFLQNINISAENCINSIGTKIIYEVNLKSLRYLICGDKFNEAFVVLLLKYLKISFVKGF